MDSMKRRLSGEVASSVRFADVQRKRAAPAQVCVAPTMHHTHVLCIKPSPTAVQESTAAAGGVGGGKATSKDTHLTEHRLWVACCVVLGAGAACH